MKKLVFVAILLMIVPVAALAVPTPEATREVVAHYLDGTDPVLVDVKFCAAIGTEGAEKNECVSEIDPMAIAADSTVYVWMNFLVPQNASPSLSILFSRNNRPASSANVDLKPSLKSLTWATLPTGKAGSYTAQIDQEVGDNFVTLESVRYQVQ